MVETEEASENEFSLLHLTNCIDEASGETIPSHICVVSGDSWSDKEFMSWLFEPKAADSSSMATYHDLNVQKHLGRKEDAIGGITALNARQTGLANIAPDSEMDVLIDSDHRGTEQRLRTLTEKYGRDHLDNLSPEELYTLFKDQCQAAK